MRCDAIDARQGIQKVRAPRKRERGLVSHKPRLRVFQFATKTRERAERAACCCAASAPFVLLIFCIFPRNLHAGFSNLTLLTGALKN
jgi:hypothetical protein